MLDASSGDPYALGYGLRVGVLSDVDDITGFPHTTRESTGFLDPQNWRFHDLEQLTSSQLEDRRMSVQLVAEGPRDNILPGAAPFGQDEFFDPKNRSTRIIDDVGRVGLLAHQFQVVDSADGRYTLGQPISSFPLFNRPVFQEGASTPFGNHADEAEERFKAIEGFAEFRLTILRDLDRPDTLPPVDFSRLDNSGVGWGPEDALALTQLDFSLGYITGTGAHSTIKKDQGGVTLTRGKADEDRKVGKPKIGLLSTVFLPEAFNVPLALGVEGTQIGRLSLRHDADFAMGPVHKEYGALLNGPLNFLDFGASATLGLGITPRTFTSSISKLKEDATRLTEVSVVADGELFEFEVVLEPNIFLGALVPENGASISQTRLTGNVQGGMVWSPIIHVDTALQPTSLTINVGGEGDGKGNGKGKGGDRGPRGPRGPRQPNPPPRPPGGRGFLHLGEWLDHIWPGTPIGPGERDAARGGQTTCDAKKEANTAGAPSSGDNASGGEDAGGCERHSGGQSDATTATTPANNAGTSGGNETPDENSVDADTAEWESEVRRVQDLISGLPDGSKEDPLDGIKDVFDELRDEQSGAIQQIPFLIKFIEPVGGGLSGNSSASLYTPGMRPQVSGPNISLGLHGAGHPRVHPDPTGERMVIAGVTSRDPTDTSVAFGAWSTEVGNTANVRTPVFGIGRGPKTIEDSLRYTQIAQNSMQAMWDGLAGGFSELIAPLSAVTRENRPHLMGQHYGAHPGDDKVISTPTLSVHSVLEPAEGSSIRATGTGIFSVSSEQRGPGSVTDVRPLILLQPDGGHDGDLISSLDRGFAVTSGNTLTAEAVATPSASVTQIKLNVTNPKLFPASRNNATDIRPGSVLGTTIEQFDFGLGIFNDDGDYVSFLNDNPASETGNLITFHAPTIFNDVVTFNETVTINARLDPWTVEFPDRSSADVPVGEQGFHFDSSVDTTRPLWTEGNPQNTHVLAFLSDVGGGGDHDVSDAATNTSVAAVELSHVTSAVATAGFGLYQNFSLEDAGGTASDAARLDVSWATATAAAEDAIVTLSAMVAGLRTGMFSLRGDDCTILAATNDLNSNTGGLISQVYTNDTNAAKPNLTLRTRTNNTAAANLGVEIRAVIDNDAGTAHDAGLIRWDWDLAGAGGAVAGSERSNLGLYRYQGGSEVQCARFDQNGTTFFDPTDPTQSVLWLTSSLTGGAARQITIQDQSGTMALLSDITAADHDVSDAATNTTSQGVQISHQTSGTVVAGFAVHASLALENAAGTLEVEAARLQAEWSDPAGGSEDAFLESWICVAGTMVAVTKVTGDGLLPVVDATYDLGEAGFSWLDIHLDGDLVTSTGTLALPSGTGTLALDGAPHDVSDAGIATTPTAIVLSHKSTSTPSAGFGVGLAFELENDSTVENVPAASIVAAWDDPTSLGEDAQLGFWLSVAGTETKRIVMDETGLHPFVDDLIDLGSSTKRWKDAYLSGAIKDGTNTFTLPSSTGTLALATASPAILDSDFSAGEGFMRKTGAGAYEAIKSNLAATTSPGVSDDGTAGYAVGSLWIDTTGDDVWQCVDTSTGAAVWKDLSTDTGGGGVLLQAVHFTNTTERSATAAMVEDDTVPTSSEMTAIATTDWSATPTYTPTISGSTTFVALTLHLGSSSTADRKLAAGLLLDSETDMRVIGMGWTSGNGQVATVTILYRYAHGSTAAQTWHAYFGAESNTVYVGQPGTAARFGGTLISTLTIYEIQE